MTNRGKSHDWRKGRRVEARKALAAERKAGKLEAERKMNEALKRLKDSK